MELTAADLDVIEVGEGPRVVLVHGGVVGAEQTWRKQQALADRWTLVMPNRPGFAGSPPLDHGDFEVEAPLMAELLGEGAHLVGHSYGAVIALLAAAHRPEAVRSLTVSEPGALRVAAGSPEVDAIIANGEYLYRHRDSLPKEAFLRAFREGTGSANETPERLPESLEKGAELLRSERPPWEAEVPTATLAGAPFPKLVISGKHSPAFEAVCDVIAKRIGAERAGIPGRKHTIPSTGAPYNQRLARFLSASERS